MPRRWLLAVESSSMMILSSFGILAPVLGSLGGASLRCCSKDSVSWKVR